MSKSNSFETDLLLLLLNNTAIANLGDVTGVRGSSTAGSVYVALHTADPGEAGNAQTSEATYTSYGRVAVARSSAGWTVASGSATNAATVTFPACTGGSNTLTYFSLVVASSGASEILYSGPLNSQLIVSNGITPAFAAGQLVVNED